MTDADADLKKQIEDQQTALDEAKTVLTEAYKKAIEDAIETNNGKISEAIAAAVQTAQEALQTQIKTIDTEIKSIKDEITGIKESIKTIDDQMAGINASITDLKNVDATLNTLIGNLDAKAKELEKQLADNATADAATKKALEAEITSIKTLLAGLQAEDKALDQKITDLKTYVDGEITATEDWAEATFATLEQYGKMQTELATLKSLIEQTETDITAAYTKAITDAIAASETTMKAWVNKTLADGYYDITAMDGLLQALETKLTDADADLKKQIEDQQTALEEAKEALTAAYKKAIKEAIETNNGKISEAIAAAVQAAQEALQGNIDTINSDITGIKNRLDKLEARIQSIRFLPEYSDGKVKFEPEMTSVALTFIVSPKEAAAIAADKVTAFIYHTQSRAVDAQQLAITAVSGNAATGMLTVTITPLAEDYWATSKTANIYIQIDDDNNDIISEMIPAFYYAEPPYVTFSATEKQTFSWAIPEQPMSLSARSSRTTTTGTFEYSVGGDDWAALAENQTVTFGGTNGDLRLRGIAPEGTYGKKIKFGNETPVACSGDIRTLVDWENHTGANTENAVFADLFYNCTQLTSAPALPATKLSEFCYYRMFYGCTNLTTAPTLSATQMAVYSYGRMFYGCSSLSTAPALPATILAAGCYEAMFLGCTSLTAAPELKATTLVGSCYSMMFQNCSNLSSITMLATEGFDEDYCLDSWLSGVNPTGTFTRAEGMESIPTNSTSGIPTGWTVKVKSVEQEKETLPGFNYVNGY